MSGSPALLVARDLHIGHRQRTLLRAVELSIEAGQCWFMLGPNGAGKSTLLAALAGIASPQAGRVELGGRAPEAWPRSTRARRLALLPQADAGGFGGTLREFVTLGRFPWRGLFGAATAEDAAIVEAEIGAFELQTFAEQPFEQLSGGERQRARLAQVFVQRAPLLLLDEPFTHLDLRHQVALAARLRAHCDRSEGAVFAVVHDFGWTIDAADRLAFAFADGRFETGPAAEMLEAGRLHSLLGCRFTELLAVSPDPAAESAIGTCPPPARRIWLPHG